MKKILVALLALLLVAVPLYAMGKSKGKQNNLKEYGKQMMVIETDLGNITIAFFPNAAPKHCQQIEKLAKDGFFNGCMFHRVIPGFVIQAGDPLTKDPSKKAMWGTGRSTLPNILAEFNSISHTKGMVGAARSQDPNSANSQFYICVGDATFLDGQYTVFGEVVKGMDVAEAISRVPRNAQDCPNKNVEIKKAYLIETPAGQEKSK